MLDLAFSDRERDELASADVPPSGRRIGADGGGAAVVITIDQRREEVREGRLRLDLHGLGGDVRNHRRRTVHLDRTIAVEEVLRRRVGRGRGATRGVSGAFQRDGDGRGIGAVLELAELGVLGRYVEGERTEPHHRHDQERDEHGVRTSLVVEDPTKLRSHPPHGISPTAVSMIGLPIAELNHDENEPGVTFTSLVATFSAESQERVTSIVVEVQSTKLGIPVASAVAKAMISASVRVRSFE